MGLNTVVMVLNDHLYRIRDDPQFGRKLYDAICSFPHADPFEYLHGSAKVISVAHADYDQFVRVGGNTGSVLPRDEEEAVLRVVRRKRKSK